MQGLGNDFIVLTGFDLIRVGGEEIIADWQLLAPDWAKRLCERHFGIGADGLIVLFDLSEPANHVPSFVRRYNDKQNSRYAWSFNNSDGSWPETCGNALRCAARYLTERGLEREKVFSIATKLGAVQISLNHTDDIETNLGAPILAGKEIPTSWNIDRCVDQTLTLECFAPPISLSVTAIGMGNPHCVIFESPRQNFHLNSRSGDEGEAKEHLEKLARAIQSSDYFPESVNVEFASVTNKSRVSLDVFERGCGWTLACGTGAAATLVAGVLTDRLDRECEISLPGGIIHASWLKSDNHVKLRGPAKEVFSGVIDTKTILNYPQPKELREVRS
jgi:diaminopimelate epimerase